MRFKFGKLALLLTCLSLASAVPELLAKKKDKAGDSGPNEQKRAVQALNRLTFGPRPGDVQQVMAMGVDRWIDLQLHPEKISDAAVESRLAAFRTLHMSAKEIAEEFPDNPMIKQVMDGKRPMPSDPAKRAVFQVQIARLQEKQEKKQRAAAPVAVSMQAADSAKTAEELAAASGDASAAAPNNLADSNSMSVDSRGVNAMTASNGEAESDGLRGAGALPASGTPTNAMSPTPPKEAKPMAVDDAEARRREDRLYADLKIQSLIDLPPDQRYKNVIAMSADEQVAFADSLRGGKGQDFLAGMNAKQKETLLAMNNPQAVVSDELVQAKLLRAIYSERQLEEVMTDFWFNHFNVFAGKGSERLFLTNYEQDVIRPRALGRFEDLLVATAKSPAMLFYLDNWLSVGPDSEMALGIAPLQPHRRVHGPSPNSRPQRPRGNKAKQASGLNENYGRELMELHTLSVNGGYSQKDVTEVAKVFPGWTLDQPRKGGDFRFEPRMHEPGTKIVLGHRIKEHGEKEGLEVLHLLAHNPNTAHFISQKLAMRFVSDDPPPALVDRMTKTFLKKKGDIREVLRTMFKSPEFWSPEAYRAKVKTPLEFIVSAVRASGAQVEDARALVGTLNNMAMMPFGMQPPTGFSMKADVLVNSSAVLGRMNFALGLAAGKIRGIKIDSAAGRAAAAPEVTTDAQQTLATLENSLLSGDISKQ